MVLPSVTPVRYWLGVQRLFSTFPNSWPGLGRLILESITTRDYPIVQAGVLVLSALYLVGNLLVDMLYSYLNPRIRHARA